MFQELFIALFKAGLPIAAVSYGLVWWAVRNRHIELPGSVGDMEKEVKRLAKNAETKKSGDPVHDKWLAFGGGFYGVMGVFTYVVVEFGDIIDFFAQFSGFGDLLSSLSFNLVIGFFLNAVMNFVVAITWPMYWLTHIHSNYIWIWAIVAYAAYWGGARLALQQSGKGGLPLAQVVSAVRGRWAMIKGRKH